MMRLPVIFFLLGIIITFAASYDLVPYLRGIGWRSTAGQILDSQLEFTNEQYGGPQREPAIRYFYYVNDQYYTASQISLGRLPHTEAGLDRLLRRFSTQTVATVYYNPSDPTQAVLIRTPDQWLLLAWLLGVAVLWGSGVLLVTKI